MSLLLGMRNTRRGNLETVVALIIFGFLVYDKTNNKISLGEFYNGVLLIAILSVLARTQL